MLVVSRPFIKYLKDLIFENIQVESPSFYRSNYDTENEMMAAILTNIEQILIERNDEIAGFILDR